VPKPKKDFRDTIRGYIGGVRKERQLTSSSSENISKARNENFLIEEAILSYLDLLDEGLL
jgi:hypothetical protein